MENLICSSELSQRSKINTEDGLLPSQNQLIDFIKSKEPGLQALFTYPNPESHSSYQLQVTLYFKTKQVYIWDWEANATSLQNHRQYRTLTFNMPILDKLSSDDIKFLKNPASIKYNLIQDHAKYTVLDIDTFQTLISDKFTNNNAIINSMDIISLYQIIGDKSKTLEIFDYFVELFSNYNTKSLLSLYLMANALVAGMIFPNDCLETNADFADGIYGIYRERDLSDNKLSSIKDDKILKTRIVLDDGYNLYVQDISKKNHILITDIRAFIRNL